MLTRCWVLVLIWAGALAGPVDAAVEQDAAAVADRYYTAMQRKGYSFLSKDELERRRDQVEAFVRDELDPALAGVPEAEAAPVRV